MKNMRRVLLKKKNQRDRNKSSTTSPAEALAPPMTGSNRRVSEMPVSLSMHVSPRRESAPIPLISNTTEAWTTNTKPTTSSTMATTPVPKVNVGFVDDGQILRDREGVISITKDVQKFLATISELRQAMEELDSHPQIHAPVIRLLLDNDDDDNDVTSSNINGSLSEEEDDEDEIMDDRSNDDNVIGKLRELAEVVEVCLQSNPGMQSTVLISASKDLLKTYKNCSHDDCKVCVCPHCTSAIDNLVNTFTQCVYDYMNGDNTTLDMLPNNYNGSLGNGGNGIGFVGGGGGTGRGKQMSIVQNKSLGFSKSYDNLAMFSSNLDISQLHDPVIDRIDQALSCVENSVAVASNYIKFRQKYHREVVGYLNKRAQLEQKYYSQLGRIVKLSQNTLTEMEPHKDSLPLVNVFRQSLENDSRYAMNCNTTFNLQVNHKILEPLERQMEECEKTRKILMNNWLRESKKAVESRSSMKNAKAKYEFYGQELVRIKNLLGNEPVGPKAERRKKEISDLETKWQESEGLYKESVAHCNDCQYQVHEMAQKSILCAFRRIIVGLDTALKSGLENYFSLQHNFFRSLPDPLLEDIKQAQEYEVGSEFLHFITLQRQVADDLEDYHFEEFDPESSDLWDIQEESGNSNNKSMNSDLSRSTLALNTTTVETKTGNDRALSPTSFDHTSGFKSLLQRNETPSPKSDSRRNRPKSMALLDTFASISSPSFYTDSPKTSLQRRNSEKSKDASSVSPPLTTSIDEVVYSKMAKTHTLKKLRTPARCRGCDTYVYFHGFDCETCGLACHRKCISTLAIRCGSKRLPRKMNVFGIDFHEHLKATKRMIPIIVTKCINEIDSRGLDTQGLYRISSAKSKMEKLCQLFESGSERVDLSELAPHLISSCLKLYFRQLPEPLLPFDMYQEFLTFATEASYVLPCNFEKSSSERIEKAKEFLERLEELINRLPTNSQLTLARLMYHLNRVSSPDHVRVNCMPASNLGIVFGPNLLTQKEVVPSLALLANMSLQAKAVEIMVAHAHDIFHIPEEQIIQLEIDSSEDNYGSNYQHTNEISVDSIETPEVIEIKSDINDTRTPMSTPPERRKQNVEELHEMIEGFSNGNLLSPVSTQRSKSLVLPPTVTASPLLTDSRHWIDCNDNSTILPGCIEDNFAESILNSLDKKLVRPHSTIEKVLTPVMEIKDDAQLGDESSDEGTEIQILTVSDNNLLDRPCERRKTQSMTKSCSTGEETDSIDESDVFHSRTASNASSNNCETGMYMGSRSEDNLLQHNGTCNYDGNGSVKVENDFLKFVNDCNLEGPSSDSTDSLKYSPFESPGVQALLKPSKPHPLSLPNTYPRPTKTSLIPVRQMSEGEIKPVRPVFSVESPPLDSPVSFRSIDKSISLASSQDNFSEGIVEDMSSPSDSIKQSNTKQQEEQDNMELDGDKKDAENRLRKEKNRPVSIVSTDDIPLPDDSPVISNSKLMRYHQHKHSLSRDSGLSDSPDPFVDISLSPFHTINSHVLTDKLTQMTKGQMSPLVNRNQVPNPDQLPDNTKRFQELLQTTSTTTKPRPQKLTKHIVRVMKITPSFDSKNDNCLSPSDGDQIQRLRMASPEELGNPSEKELEFHPMKRSLSQGHVLKSEHSENIDNIEDGTRVAEGLYANTKRYMSSHKGGLSRSLENLLDNF